MEHWLLYTSDREHGGTKILGVFGSCEDAWDYYYKMHNKDEMYWRIPFVEQWENGKKVGD